MGIPIWILYYIWLMLEQEEVGPREISQPECHWHCNEVNIKIPYFEGDMLLEPVSYMHTLSMNRIFQNFENNSAMYRLTYNHELDVSIKKRYYLTTSLFLNNELL